MTVQFCPGILSIIFMYSPYPEALDHHDLGSLLAALAGGGSIAPV